MMAEERRGGSIGRRGPGWLKRGCLLALAALAAAGGAVQAQEVFPARPIELIVVLAPGGGLDTTGRILAELVAPILGTKVVVTNRVGAGGAVGLAHVAAAKPDGYTLAMVYPAPLTIAPHTMNVSYTPEDFVPVTQVTGGTALIFCVKPDFPARTAREFIEHVRRNPERYTYANDGVGAMVQLAGERLFQPLGLKLRPVPVTGAAESLKLFLGGHVDIYGGSLEPIAGHVKDGKAHCVLSTSAARSPLLPNTDSAGDIGLADRATDNWRGVLAPRGLPADRLRVLEAAFRKAALMEKHRAFAGSSGAHVIAGTSEEFRTLIAKESRDFAKVVESLGLAKK